MEKWKARATEHTTSRIEIARISLSSFWHAKLASYLVRVKKARYVFSFLTTFCISLMPSHVALARSRSSTKVFKARQSSFFCSSFSSASAKASATAGVAVMEDAEPGYVAPPPRPSASRSSAIL